MAYSKKVLDQVNHFLSNGVDIIDPDQKSNWFTKDGRWWLGLYSNSSDMVSKRAQGARANISSKFA